MPVAVIFKYFKNTILGMVGDFSSMLNVFLLFLNSFLRFLFFLAGLIPQLLQKSHKQSTIHSPTFGKHQGLLSVHLNYNEILLKQNSHYRALVVGFLFIRSIQHPTNNATEGTKGKFSYAISAGHIRSSPSIRAIRHFSGYIPHLMCGM